MNNNQQIFNIEINEKFAEALQLMEETNRNVFVTGKAGTGKSTLLDYFRNTTKKRIVVLASTGVAAVNIKGQTVHSFFKFKPNITIDKVKRIVGKGKGNIYKQIDTIIIDEISMIRADLLDCVDKFLRLNRGQLKKCFGGVQMIFIGDLYQLPPVVTGKEKEIFKNKYKTEYFFSAELFEYFDMELIELEKIYRQKDEKFIEILNAIRNNTITEEQLKILNKRYSPDFEPEENEFYIYLTSRNEQADIVNKKQLQKLNGKFYTFKCEIIGNFEKSYLPTEEILQLKKGAQVMLLNNDSYGRWVNGSIGKIVDIWDDEEEIIEVELSNGEIVEVERFKWQIFEYYYDKETNSINTRTIGSFNQFPLRLSWAITIHKSQGKTFDKVIIDIGRGIFATGQTYVALSRCTSLEGTVLKQKIEKKHIFTDRRVINFVTKYQYKKSEEKIPLSEKIEIIKNAIKNKAKIEIVYLKTNDEKSKRIIQPSQVGELLYENKCFIGVEAYCYNRNDVRNFRVDRILEIREINE